MPPFFRHVVIPASETARHADAIRRLRQEQCEGILVTGVYDPAACAVLCERLEFGDHGLIETSFPAPFRSFFLGMNLNLSPPDLAKYFQVAPAFKQHLASLFHGFAPN